MRANKCILLLLPAVSPVPFTAALQYTSNVVCNITFSDGSQPNFLLPEAGPNSPGDQQLNEDNPLVEKSEWNNELVCVVQRDKDILVRMPLLI